MPAERSLNKLYLLNTPVLTAYGDWRFEPLRVERARELVRGEFVSAVGHPASAQFLAAQLGVEVPVNRVAIEMQPGDRAVVLRLKGRLPEGAVLTEEQMRDLPFELALLTRLPARNALERSLSSGAYSARLDQALTVAAIAHAKKTRKGTAVPYLIHPFHVGLILDRHGASEDLVIAGLLHDVLEDALWGDGETQRTFRETYAELREANSDPGEFRAAVEAFFERTFGTAVLELVRSVSEQKLDATGQSRAWRVRKQEQLEHLGHTTPAELALKAADLLHNLQATLRDLAAQGLQLFHRFNAQPQDQVWYASHVLQTIRLGLGDDNALADELRQLFGRYARELATQALAAQDTSLYEATQEALRRAVQAAAITLSKAEVIGKLKSPPADGRWVLAVDPESLQARIVPQQADGFVPGVEGQEDLFPLSMATEREDGFIEPGDWLIAQTPEKRSHDGWYRGYLVRWSERS